MALREQPSLTGLIDRGIMHGIDHVCSRWSGFCPLHSDFCKLAAFYFFSGYYYKDPGHLSLMPSYSQMAEITISSDFFFFLISFVEVPLLISTLCNKELIFKKSCVYMA